MSKNNVSSTSPTKKMTIASIIALVSFIAFVGFTTMSVMNVSDLISRSSFSDRDGIPNLWEGTTFSSPVSINTEVKSAGDHLSYLTVIENKDSEGALVLTDLASRISDSKHTGFIAFAGDSLEYSYSRGSEATWTQVNGHNIEGTYTLDRPIQIGPAGEDNSRVYLRYNLSPENGNVTDKISFRLQDIDNNYSVASSESSIAYEETSSEIVAVENNRSDDNSGESAFAEPLGVFSESSNLSSISTASAVLASISPESASASTIVIIAVLGLFVGSLIAFLIIKNHNTRKVKTK